jgi:hypothetical protein
MAVENYFFLSVSCDLVTLVGNARIAYIAGLFVVDADHAGVAQRAIDLADRLALIVCNIFAHLRPVFYAVKSAYGLSRSSSDAAAKIVWRAHATIASRRTMFDAAIFTACSLLICTKMTNVRFNYSD